MISLCRWGCDMNVSYGFLIFFFTPSCFLADGIFPAGLVLNVKSFVLGIDSCYCYFIIRKSYYKLFFNKIAKLILWEFSLHLHLNVNTCAWGGVLRLSICFKHIDVKSLCSNCNSSARSFNVKFHWLDWSSQCGRLKNGSRPLCSIVELKLLFGCTISNF